jgi:hypothetical protein
VSVPWADAQECPGSGGVAGVATQGGGDVAVPAGVQDTDGQGCAGWPWPGGRAGTDLGGVLGDGDIAEVVQRLDAPVAPDPIGQAGGLAAQYAGGLGR